MNHIFRDRRSVVLANIFMLAVLYFLTAAATYNGFYRKYGLRDGETRFSVDLMLDGTASRPFAYRQLLPATANLIAAHLPEHITERLEETFTTRSEFYGNETRFGLRLGVADQKIYAVRYYIIYTTAFMMYFAALFFMREFCMFAGASQLSSTGAPVVFSLLLPTLLSIGGYFYDFSEIFFFFLSLCLARSQHRWALIPVAAIGTFNKEPYLVFLLSLAPLVIRSRTDRRGMAFMAAAAGASALVYLALKLRFEGNPGGNMENHLLQNLRFYPNPLSLFQGQIAYGLPMFAGYSIVTAIIVIIVFRRGWSRMDRAVRQSVLLAASLNVPLVLAFSYPGEIRNLSMIFPALVSLIALTIDALAKRQLAHVGSI